jgi:hypothetical protein
MQPHAKVHEGNSVSGNTSVTFENILLYITQIQCASMTKAELADFIPRENLDPEDHKIEFQDSLSLNVFGVARDEEWRDELNQQ